MMLVNREEQLALDFDALFADPPDYGAAIDEDEMSIDWALEEI
jgi:hypothetical protein